MSLRSLWQVVASWTFTALFCTTATAVTLLTFGRFSHRLTPRMLRFWGRTMLRIADITCECEGAEHLDTGTMKIATFNHASLLDAFIISSIMPSSSFAAIKREVVYYPFIGITAYSLGFLLIDRGNNARARKVMDRARDRIIREKLTVFIAPEGTRSPTPELLPFKKGAFHLALDSRAPIVPVVVDGAFELHPPGRLISKSGHIRIRVLPPRSSDHLTTENLAAEAQALRATYVVELARLRAEREAEPVPGLAPTLVA